MVNYVYEGAEAEGSREWQRGCAGVRVGGVFSARLGEVLESIERSRRDIGVE